VFPVPEVSYFYILVVVVCMILFAGGARMEGKSPLVWGGLSFGSWLLFTHWCMSGVAGGLISQAILFVWLGCYGILRDRRRQGRRDRNA
jgi:hypothetical protein